MLENNFLVWNTIFLVNTFSHRMTRFFRWITCLDKTFSPWITWFHCWITRFNYGGGGRCPLLHLFPFFMSTLEFWLSHKKRRTKRIKNWTWIQTKNKQKTILLSIWKLQGILSQFEKIIFLKNFQCLVHWFVFQKNSKFKKYINC